MSSGPSLPSNPILLRLQDNIVSLTRSRIELELKIRTYLSTHHFPSSRSINSSNRFPYSSNADRAFKSAPHQQHPNAARQKTTHDWPCPFVFLDGFGQKSFQCAVSTTISTFDTCFRSSVKVREKTYSVSYEPLSESAWGRTWTTAFRLSVSFSTRWIWNCG